MRTICLAVGLVALTSVAPSPAAAASEKVEPTHAAPRPETGPPAFSLPTAWFVEMESSPTADGGSLSTVRSEQAAFRLAAKGAGLKYKERYSFGSLWNGVSLELERSEVGALSRLPGVKAIYPVGQFEPPPQERIEPQLATALTMTGADVAQSQLGYTGDGVRVGVIDSGVDYDHPDLGGCFGANCRVAAGYDFTGDDFDAGDPEHSTPMPDADPDDCLGHGTHVAGIVGANGEVKGVAPRVTFGAYRIFGCRDGATSDDVVIAAMERALADGMDVVNMSFGESRLGSWPNHPWAKAADRLVGKGVAVVGAAGNAGNVGLYAVIPPSSAKDVISAASFENTGIDVGVFTASPDGRRVGYTRSLFAERPPTSGSLPLARTGTATSTADACSELPAGSLATKAALIRRGGCPIGVKLGNAFEAGAAAVVIYNDEPGLLTGGLPAAEAQSPPVVGISKADGDELDDRLASGPVTLTWTDQRMSVPNPRGGLISPFSSYGPPPDLSLKPDIGAPGGQIHSTLPLEQGGYATTSGTSMAAPHVAGAAALLLEAKPSTPANAIRDALQNSADPRPWWGNPGRGLLDNAHRQGAGMLDIDDAIRATTQVTPGKLALGESESGPKTKTLTITNSAGRAVTYDLSHAPALSTGPNTFFPNFFTGFASVAFSVGGAQATSVTVPAHGSATVDATIAANPSLPDRSLYDGYLVLTPEDSGSPLRVPYLGFKGDYQSIVALPSTAQGFPEGFEFPWLAKFGDGTFPRQTDGALFTMQGFDVPWVVFNLAHHTRRFEITISDADSGKSWHRAFLWEYTGRNHVGEAFVFPIDGNTTNGRKQYTLPNGRYKATVSVLKALGDPNNPQHTERWTSPAFRIDRP